MYNSDDDDTFSHDAGYITPPLSPTKSISTEGWHSPRTPGSPRKTRSCVFVRDFESVGDHPFITPPPSPVKSKFTPSLSTLSIPELLATHGSSSPCLDDDSPTKPRHLSHGFSVYNYQSDTLVRSQSLSEAAFGHELGVATDASSTDLDDYIPLLNDSDIRLRPCSSRSVSETHLTPMSRPHSPTSSSSDSFVTHHENGVLSLATVDLPDTLPVQTCHLPLRCVSSPLRPSQHTVRGGLTSSPGRLDTNTPDRFIASRRPPAVTRDSFKLNKPMKRLQLERSAHRGARRQPDAFSRRLRRSGRMNEELRGLREANFLIVGRTGAGERNNNVRRGSTPLGARQVSVGAVWNVGGPSAVSDTVVAVSTGRGSMLGRGTNAPLYQSAFLNRADPEAELEAYERRLALALDVDQTERILQHSPANLGPAARFGTLSSDVPHAWRDGVWIKDGVTSRLSSFLFRVFVYMVLTVRF
ncbi:hypothetical protein NX059_008371 [Plenodomus lindquistii]|nr:hypothetical protein NX059_008371 [Plenodomus lindquistii]